MKTIVILAALAGTATAGNPVPTSVPFAARVTDANGPINGSVSITLSIYDVASGGTSAWTESYPNATAFTGLVYLQLGSMTALDTTVFDGGAKYLEVSVNSTTMSPRVFIGSAPYALHASSSDFLGTLAPTDVQERVVGMCASGAISAISAGGGVTCVPVGQTYTGSGGVSVSGTTVSLSNSGCANGYVWKYNGSAFSCSPDLDTIYTGTGGVAVTGTVVSLDATGCAAGYVWTYNGSAFACMPQVTYTAGTGISIASNQISVSTIPIANGGTGATTATGAIDALLPAQGGNANDILTTNSTNPFWATVRNVLATGDDSGLVVKGTFTGTAATPPATGAGARMMWYPQRAAFRAGSVTGTQWDDANTGNRSFAAGGSPTASGADSVALGDQAKASNSNSVAVGPFTTASGSFSVAIGDSSTASGDDSFAMGAAANGAGNYAFAIGENVGASNQSFALGFSASTNGQTGAFVYGDASTTTIFNAVAQNTFNVRSAGGVTFYTNSALTAGVTVGAGGGSWTSVSDRNMKTDFASMNGETVLAKIDDMTIGSWRYKSELSGARHVGPMAQDFYAAFGLGDSDKTITNVDIDGINLLAIQTLARENAELKARLDAVEAKVQRMECRP